MGLPSAPITFPFPGRRPGLTYAGPSGLGRAVRSLVPPRACPEQVEGRIFDLSLPKGENRDWLERLVTAKPADLSLITEQRRGVARAQPRPATCLP